MRRAGAWLLAGAMLASPRGAAAAGAAGSADPDACRAKAVSTFDIVQCQKAELAGVEGRLNAAYKAALAALPDDQRAKLVAAERLWVAFRHADCDVFYGAQTGTIASVEAGDCMIGHARARVADLDLLKAP